MEFRNLGEKRFIRRPMIDAEDLRDTDSSLAGEFELQDERIGRLDQSGANGNGVLSRCLLEGIDASGSRVYPLLLEDVTLRRVTLNNAQWTDVGARRVELVECQAIGWNFGCGIAGDVYAADCRFDYGRLTVERAKGIIAFENCSFRGTTIRGSLTKAVFAGCTFEDVEFQATDATGCDLTRSDLAGAHGLLSLRGARITSAQAVAISVTLARESGFTVSE